MRDSYTNRMHSPSHEMWSYERDGRWRGWSFVRGSTVVINIGEQKHNFNVALITYYNVGLAIIRHTFSRIIQKNGSI